MANYYYALSTATSVRDEKAIKLMYKIKNSYNELKKDKDFKDNGNKLLRLNSVSPRLLLAYCKVSGMIKR